MNTKNDNNNKKMRGDRDVSYLGHSVDEMIWQFMKERGIPGLTLAIVQAPYIPRVVGYGLSDVGERRLASVNTMWPIGPISQAFAAVAVMQLYEDGKLDLNDTVSKFIPNLPPEWRDITVLNLLRHSSGLPDYRENRAWNPFRTGDFSGLIRLAANKPLHFEPGTNVELSATNFLLLSKIIERASGMSYHDFITDRQINFLELRHTGFAEDLPFFPHEDVSRTGNVHQLFKTDKEYIDPAEPATGYNANDDTTPPMSSSAAPGFSDIWASAQDVSFWDIALAGSVLIHSKENRELIYAPWTLPDGREVPAVAGWQFYKHKGLMDIKGSAPGFSSFLSRFTDASELVCVTLLANKEGIDFTNLARKIAAAFGGLMATGYDDNKLYLLESQFSVDDTVQRIENELNARGIPLFAKIDHAKNAQEAGLSLRPTTVLIFGSPKTGTGLMEQNQSASLDLPLKISVWEDQSGSTWIAFPKTDSMADEYGLNDNPAIKKIQLLLEDIAQKAGNAY